LIQSQDKQCGFSKGDSPPLSRLPSSVVFF